MKSAVARSELPYSSRIKRPTSRRHRSKGEYSHETVSDIWTTKSIIDSALRLSETQAAERRRIAKELHDSTNQHLAAIGLHLLALRNERQLSSHAMTLISSIERSLDAAHKEIRSISYTMYPFELGSSSFGIAVDQFIEGFSSRTGIEVCHHTSDALDSCQIAVQRELFRILQEALANVYRHARAKHVAIRFAMRRGHAIVWIADDGRGLAADAGHQRPSTRLGLGIPGMSSRARSIGGELRIRSVPGRGTRVLAYIPIDRYETYSVMTPRSSQLHCE